jgi:hypothetical protein
MSENREIRSISFRIETVKELEKQSWERHTNRSALTDEAVRAYLGLQK